MSPLFVRIFTLVGMALAAASMQMKARADTPSGPEAQQVRVHHPAVRAFLAPQVERDQVLHAVALRDEDDKTRLALFTLQRQADNS